MLIGRVQRCRGQRRWLPGVAAAGVIWVAACSGQALLAQEPAEPAKPAVAEEVKPPKFRGRLPSFYKAVVSEMQRQKIYDIQKGYAEKIHALQTQMMELVSRRDKEVEAVLSDEQRQRVLKLVAEAKARSAKARAEAAKEKQPDPADDTEPAESE